MSSFPILSVMLVIPALAAVACLFLLRRIGVAPAVEHEVTPER